MYNFSFLSVIDVMTVVSVTLGCDLYIVINELLIVVIVWSVRRWDQTLQYLRIYNKTQESVYL